MFFVLVDVVLNGQQVVAHGLEGELMQDRGDGVKRPVQDDQLWASLVGTLQRKKHTYMNARSNNIQSVIDIHIINLKYILSNVQFHSET